MLAEMFLLQLEARKRASKEASEERKEWLIPVFPAALSELKESKSAAIRQFHDSQRQRSWRIGLTRARAAEAKPIH